MRISDWSSDVCSSDLLLAKFASADEQACETLRRFLAEPVHHAFDDRLYCQCGQRRLLRRLPDYRIPAAECEREVPAPDRDGKVEIGRGHVCTTVTNENLVCRLLLEITTKNDTNSQKT